VFVVLWTLANVFAERFGWTQFDPPPFIWLQGIVGLSGLIVATAVLIRQSRLGELAEQHAHLDLQVNLLAEQKATKIIQLLEELRRDMPSVVSAMTPRSRSCKSLPIPTRCWMPLPPSARTRKRMKARPTSSRHSALPYRPAFAPAL
jgi:uncharacterized membrane protein